MQGFFAKGIKKIDDFKEYLFLIRVNNTSACNQRFSINYSGLVITFASYLPAPRHALFTPLRTTTNSVRKPSSTPFLLCVIQERKEKSVALIAVKKSSPDGKIALRCLRQYVHFVPQQVNLLLV